MVQTPAQELISYLVNSTVGVCSTTNKPFRDADPGEPDTLVVLCIKHFFKHSDFSEYYDDIKEFVKGKSLAGFVNSHLTVCPDLIRIIVENADNKSRKNKFSIKRDEFAICAGRGRLITIPFTEDMEEPATILAEYTELLFSFPRYDIEFAFEGNYGLSRNMDLTEKHIKLLRKLTPKMFAEKGRPRRKRERNGRLQLRMSRISWNKSGFYYNAIIDFFNKLRGTIVLQGEQPLCEKSVTYEEMLQYTIAHPGEHLIDDRPNFKWTYSMKKVRKVD